MRAPPLSWALVAVALLLPSLGWWLLGGLPRLRLDPPAPTSIDTLHALSHPPGAAGVTWSVDGQVVRELEGRFSVRPERTRRGEVWRAELDGEVVEAEIRNLPPAALGWLASYPPRSDQDIELVLEGNPDRRGSHRLPHPLDRRRRAGPCVR